MTRTIDPIDPNELAEAIDLYESGWSLNQIAARLGKTSTTWHRRLALSGVVMRPPGVTPKMKLSGDERARQIAEEYERPGNTLRVLAKRYGITRQRVHQLIKRARANGPA